MSVHFNRASAPVARRTSSLLHRFRPIDPSPTEEDDLPRLGINEVTENINTPTATIVFVHGLGGHPIKTWRHSSSRDDTFWPQCWLPQEPGMENARICVFGYPAEFATTTERTSRIIDFSKTLLLDLLTSKLADAPIIFISHSMGGLIVKKAYMLAVQDTTYTDIAGAISRGAMIFLGTPHRGSDGASTLHSILCATIGSKAFVEEIKSKSGVITTINEDFRHYAKDLTLWSFYESQPTVIAAGRSVLVVDRDSAILGYENEGSSQIDGDHRSICKFESKASAGYKTIKNLLLHIIDTKILHPKQHISGLDTQSLSPSTRPPEHATESGGKLGMVARRPSVALRQLSAILGQEDTNSENLLFFRDNRIVGDSCQWIFSKDSFSWWLDSKSAASGRYLWLNGPPAAGKSVLVSAIIDQLQSEGHATAFYFFRRNNTAGRTTRSFLLSIIAQMSMFYPSFYEKLAEVDSEQAKIHTMPTRVLWQKLFVDTLFEWKDPSTKEWYWIIDALDEADAPAELISFIGKINSQTPVNVLLSSRVSMDIKRSLQTFVAKLSLREEQIAAEDTKEDMASHARHKLNSLPFESNEIEDIVKMIVSKSQGIFLWVRFAVEEILATGHTIDGVYEALEAMPSEMSSFFEQILDGMSTMRESNKRIAKAILRNTVCAMRPLKTAELQATLSPAFGRLASLDYTIKQVCPHLIKVDEASSVVQLIHETVREFLLQCTESEFFVDQQSANHDMTKTCLGVWNEDVFSSPISSSSREPRTIPELSSIHPLLYYSATSWFDHLQESVIDKPLELTLCDFLRTSILSWVEVAGLLGDLTLLTAGALALEASMMQSPLIRYADKRLMSGWAVDLIRIAPKYGRNIVAYPFSIHKLLPPFCPTKTQIGGQFGSTGDISIVGAGLRHWDDCLAHITVSRDGELCKLMVSGSTYFAVTLSGSNGVAVLYDAETCQEVRRISHGERISAIHMNSSGEHIVTGGIRSMKTWNIKSGEMIGHITNPGRSRCLAVAFRPDSKSVVSFTSNDTIAIWDLRKNNLNEIRLERPSVKGSYRGSPWGVAFDKDTTMMSLAYKGWPIEVWDIDRVEITETIPARSPLGSCFNPYNNDVYGMDHDSTVYRRDTETGNTTQIRLDAHVATCNPSGTLLATGDTEGVLKIFTADTMELLYKIDKYKDMITGLSFSPDGTKLYDIRSSECNVWIPEVLLVSVREDSSVSGVESDSSGFVKGALSGEVGTEQTATNIVALACDYTGIYVCSGKNNGAVTIHHTQTGKELQQLHAHSATSDIQALAWSADGALIASVDSIHRVIITRLQQRSSSKWSCETVRDFTIDSSQRGAVKQLLISPDGSRLLASSHDFHKMINLDTGEEICELGGSDGDNVPFWMTHPQDSDQLILLGFSAARIFRWNTFTELTGEGVLRMNHDLGAEWENKSVKTRAFPSQDTKSIVVEWSTLDRNRLVRCSTLNVTKLCPTATAIHEMANWNHLRLDNVIGAYRSQAVFLSQDLWLCSSPCTRSQDTTRHFYMPMDWLNTSDERLSAITRSGEFVYANQGEIVVVKCGMRSNQGLV